MESANRPTSLSRKNQSLVVMPKIAVEFYIKGAVANMEDAEDKRKERTALKLLKQQKHRKAIKALGPMKFEWIWMNGDGDPTELFERTDDIEFPLNSRNAKVKIGEFRRCVSLTISVKFELNPRKGVSKKQTQKWLNDNSMFFWGYVDGGWGYHQDDGGGLTVLATR